MFFLKLFFHHEGHFYVNCLFYIPTIYLKYLLFQFFSYGIRMHISILTGVENGHISRLKESVFLPKNVLFEASFRWWRSLLCQLLNLYSNYLSSKPSFSVLQSWHTYVHSHPNRGSKWTYKSPKKQSSVKKKVFSAAFFPWWRSLVCLMIGRYFDYLS